MNIYVYSDESGVFDRIHNDYFIYGGIIFLNKEDRDVCARKYIAVENVIRDRNGYCNNFEIKATSIPNVDKGKLFRSLNHYYKFGVIVHQKDLNPKLFQRKETKQRYLDYAYKICVKRLFEYLIFTRVINPYDVNCLYFFVDEHTTATDGCYELKDGLEQEFKYGTMNFEYNKFFPPIFPNLSKLCLNFCNSNKITLIRAADIIANKIYYLANQNIEFDNGSHNLFVMKLPK